MNQDKTSIAYLKQLLYNFNLFDMGIERENLEIEKDAEGIKRRIFLDPLNFSKNALREIIKFQMQSESPREIIIEKRTSIFFISAQSLKKAKSLLTEERKYYLDFWAEEMHQADTVIIQESKLQNKLK